MSKKQFKSQASSSRAVSGGGFGTGTARVGSTFGAVSSSPLSYIYEPPDLDSIEEPNVVVAFKNLQKKDSTTKAKALEDLQLYVQSLNEKNDGLEDAILEAWIKIYPRTSIENSRRVRQLAHLLQGRISLSCGKRIAKHLPNLVGPWLAGLYDTDRSVNRATKESFELVFPSEEKRSNLWRIYLPSIIAFCGDAILKETANSLSDERTTSPDDALAKHARVVGSAILILTKVVEIGPHKQSQDHKIGLNHVLTEEKIWDLSSNSDAFVRRAVYRLLVAALAKQEDTLDMKVVSAKLLLSSLHIDQMGSAIDYAIAIAQLTERCPEVWTSYYTGSGKKSSERRLQQFLKKGSQGSPPEFWGQIGSIMKNIPQEILTTNLKHVASKEEASASAQPLSSIPQAMLSALRSRDEPSRNLGAAWLTYLETLERMQTLLANKEVRLQLLEDFVLPIVMQYVKPSRESLDWVVAKGHKSQLDICVEAFLLVWRGGDGILQNHWTILCNNVIEDIKTSLPEQSKDYSKSQDSVSEETSRWFNLERAVMEVDGSESITMLFDKTSYLIVEAAIKSIKSRNGKPLGATATLMAALKFTPELIHNNAELDSMVVQFVQEDSSDLIWSPSVRYFFTILDLLQSKLDVDQPLLAGLNSLKEAPDTPEKLRVLTSLVSSPLIARADNIGNLKLMLNDILADALNGNESSRKLVQTALHNPAAPASLTDNLLTVVADSLGIEDKVLASLEGLSLIEKSNMGALKTFGTSSSGTRLLSRLLLLAETSDEETAGKARALSTMLQGIMSSEEGVSKARDPIIRIIETGLETPTPSSLPVKSLVEQACKLYSEAADEEKAGLTVTLLPSNSQWVEALTPLLQKAPNASLAIMNPLSTAAMASFGRLHNPMSEAGAEVPRDSDGFSSALRLAWYTTHLIKQTDVFSRSAEAGKVIVFTNMALVLQLAADCLSIPYKNGLWDTFREVSETQVVDLTADAQELLASWLQEKQNFVTVAQHNLLEACQYSTIESYYNARAYSAITAELAELHGYVSSHDSQDIVQEVRKSKQSESFLRGMAILSSAAESSQLTRFANELLADLSGHDFKKHEIGLRQLLYFNSISSRHPDIVAEIPKPRLVFFVKPIITALSNSASDTIRGEMIRALNVVLPSIKETYDDFWQELLAELPKIWSATSVKSDDAVPLLHASLRLLSTLRGLVSEESNDDLVDCWRENEDTIGDGLLSLLQLLHDIPDESHQPRKMTNDLLSRQLTKFPLKSMSAASELYPIIASESLALQKSAYDILHIEIPKQQEQVSLEKALTEKYVAKLPEELLSLVLAPPDQEALAEMSFERSIPVSLRSYLLSWKLVYDHWRNASYAVQADYTDTLKDGAYLNKLLDFTSKLLITERTRPVDASKFDIMKFIPEEGESPETDTHYFLIHLYTLSLTHLPNLSKTWWRDSTSRQTMIAVESWTEKYISPLIIASELTTVSTWAPSQASADQPLTVKVSQKTHEIIASIPLDEQTMSIAIRLPPSYPLARATVDSIHRVGVSESKWRSWLITTEGVINFSSEGNGGRLIEGLLAWRKNVSATLKGQAECSICYSVVSAERQLPSKRCGTCKNMFHGGCLYRWFRSSNSSSCPLCRNAFNYS